MPMLHGGGVRLKTYIHTPHGVPRSYFTSYSGDLSDDLLFCRPMLPMTGAHPKLEVMEFLPSQHPRPTTSSAAII